ncbi:MAG: hypothetical protein R2879_07855 [Saprospiraceae bacterium]
MIFELGFEIGGMGDGEIFISLVGRPACTLGTSLKTVTSGCFKKKEKNLPISLSPFPYIKIQTSKIKIQNSRIAIPYLPFPPSIIKNPLLHREGSKISFNIKVSSKILVLSCSKILGADALNFSPFSHTIITAWVFSARVGIPSGLSLKTLNSLANL